MDTTAATGLTPELWDEKFFEEYIRESRFLPYKGTSENDIIQLKDNLTAKKGDRVNFALVNKLTGEGRTGNQTLEGYEEELDSRSFELTVDPLRHAVVVSEWDEQKSAIALRDAGKTMLKLWFMEKERDHIIRAFGSINGVAYGSASEANKDAWLVDNADRVLFGSAVGNNSSNDHSASLLNVDTTNDRATAAGLRLLKRRARAASPIIRPIRIEGDQEWYVVFFGPKGWRDISADTTIAQVNRDARTRGLDNPIFTGDSLVYDGMILREVPEIATLSGVGNSGADVEPVYLTGAQAIGIGYARRFKSTTDVRDYGFKNGVGGREIRGIQKMLFGSGTGDTDDLKDHGVATWYVAAPSDT